MRVLITTVLLVPLAACASPTAFDRGLANLRAGRYAEAKAAFDEALPASAAALATRGVARARLGDLDGAIDDYTRALDLAPGDGDILFDRGNAWAAKGEYHRAMADFRRAAEADPRRAQALFRNAAIELQREPSVTAAPAVAMVPPAAPELDARALGSRALTRELQGDHAGALEDLRAAIVRETDPERLTGLRNLLLLLESQRDRRDQDVRGDSTR